jgi:pyruvate/2-oxoglutarate dehydrogenase complex dihydrolipoamide acyltransferase (E2) component
MQSSYPVGAVLGHIEATAEEAARVGLDTQEEAEEESAEEASPAEASAAEEEPAAKKKAPARKQPKKPEPPRKVTPTVRGLPVPASAGGATYMSPRMKARMNELGLHAADLSAIAGSGAAGRVTVEDLEKFLANLNEHEMNPASTMRVAVADAMRRSWTRPLATVGLQVNLDSVLKHRKTRDPKPGPALYALRALGIALGENSAAAGRLIGERLVHPPAIDLGFAVEAEDGVLVPVLRNVNKVSLADLLDQYNELVDLARQRRLPPTATGGSIATVTNFGSFGLDWATPIPLPEQTLVLGIGVGRLQPSWDKRRAQFMPVIMANLTLSFDHRVLDGGAAGRLLQRIGELMQTPEKL